MDPEMDRRNAATRDCIVRRLHAEFSEMPGISLTAAQVAKLENLSPEVCDRILRELVDAKHVRLGDDGRFSASGR